MMVKLTLLRNCNSQSFIKPFWAIGVILFAFVIVTSVQAEETPAEQLEQANLNQKQGLYSAAEQIYKDVLQENPGTDSAQKAQENLVVMYVAWDKLPEARVAYQSLSPNFSGQEELAESIHKIAYKHLKKQVSLQKSQEIYKFIVNDLSQADYAMWLQTSVVINNILAGEESAAQTALDNLLTEFAKHKDIAKAVNKIGDYYYSLNKYHKACDVFQSVVDSWPQSEYAIRSQLSLIDTYIKLSDETATKTAIDTLLTDFANHPDIDWAVKKVGDRFSHLGDYQKAHQYYQLVVNSWPQKAIWSQKNLVITYFDLGDDASAETAINKLLTDYTSDPDQAKVISRLGEQCLELGKYEKARTLYQYVVNNHPNSDCIVQSRAGLSLSNSLLVDSDNIGGAVDIIIAEFSGYDKLPEIIFKMCEQISEEANREEGAGNTDQAQIGYQQAAELAEKIIKQLPQSSLNPSVCYLAADCYRPIGEYEKAIAYYQQIITNWPEYSYTWSAQFLIGHCYVKMEKAGLLSDAEANVKIRVAYEQVLAKYPNCPAAPAAQIWLKRHTK